MSREDDDYLRRNTRPLIGPGMLGELPADTDYTGAPTVIDLNTAEGRQQYELERIMRDRRLRDYPKAPADPYGAAPWPRPEGARPVRPELPAEPQDPPGDALVPWRFIEPADASDEPEQPWRGTPWVNPGQYGSTIYEHGSPGRKPVKRVLATRGKPVRVRYAVRVRVHHQPRRLGGLIEEHTRRVVLEEAEFTAYVVRMEYEGESFIWFAGKDGLRFRMPLARIIWIKYRDPRC